MRLDIARVVCEELFLVRNVIFVYTTKRKEFPYEQEARKVNLKVNKVCIVSERISKLLFTSTASQEGSRVESEKKRVILVLI